MRDDKTKLVTEAAPVSYRCVCGEESEVDARLGGVCAACRRQISVQLLVSARNQTVSLPAGATAARNISLSRKEKAQNYSGKTFGHFKVLSLLGAGGMGAVYRALDESLQRYVALKIIDESAVESGIADAGRVEYLLHEARAQARVNHDHIAHIYYVGREHNTAFLAMELVDGPALAERVEHGPLSYAEIIDLAIQVVEALEHSARFDVVHGDIKPGNIMLREGRDVKLTDFGLARRISVSTESDATINGTPNYMSPETCRGEPATVLSDQYSLGVMLFEMTFGRLPYKIPDRGPGSRIEGVMRAHQSAPADFPEDLPEDVPPAWREILERMLSKNHAQRFPNYAELLAKMRQARPVDMVQAGRLPRSLAWLLDLTIVTSVTQLVFFASLLRWAMPQEALRPFISVLACILVCLPPVLIALVQSRWGTTPAKKIFQLRIVDQHAQRPSRSALWLRSIAQFSPAWVQSLAGLLIILDCRPEWFSLAAGIPLLLWLVPDAGLLLIDGRARSLHDRIFGTRVVLDAIRQR